MPAAHVSACACGVIALGAVVWRWLCCVGLLWAFCGNSTLGTSGSDFPVASTPLKGRVANDGTIRSFVRPAAMPCWSAPLLVALCYSEGGFIAHCGTYLHCAVLCRGTRDVQKLCGGVKASRTVVSPKLRYSQYPRATPGHCSGCTACLFISDPEHA